MSSSVKAKAIFPSISITKKKGKTASGSTPQTSNAQSLPFLRPLTPVCNLNLVAFVWCDLGYFKQAMNYCFCCSQGIHSQASSPQSERTRSKFSCAWCFTGSFTVAGSVVEFRRNKPISAGKWISIEPVNPGFTDRVQACSEYKSAGEFEASGCYFTQRILFFGHIP